VRFEAKETHNEVMDLVNSRLDPRLKILRLDNLVVGVMTVRYGKNGQHIHVFAPLELLVQAKSIRVEVSPSTKVAFDH